MQGIKEQLKLVFDELSEEYDIESVDYVPIDGKREKIDVPAWHMTILAEIAGMATEMEMFIAFPHNFPFEIPFVVVPEQRFRHLPHISWRKQKVCLYDDGTTYDTNNVRGIVRETNKRAIQWVEKFANQENTEEYKKEIINYWCEQYDSESKVNGRALFIGDVPNSLCELKGFDYQFKSLKTGRKKIRRVFYSIDDDSKIINYLKKDKQTSELPVLYITSLEIPQMPPYSFTGDQLIEGIKDRDELAAFRKVLNKNGYCYLVFRIGVEYALGCIHIGKMKVVRPGFRTPIKPFDLLGKFEYKIKKLDRLMVFQYDNKRIANRTAGELMEQKSLAVVGLGSVGSNLCYYLDGYNNARFALIDKDSLRVENIGRHLLGYDYLNQNKAFAVADYLRRYRPDREVECNDTTIECIDGKAFDDYDAMFVCTGDVMSERWVISQLMSKELKLPVFMLWLEPFAVSGTMVYVNPEDNDSMPKLKALSEKNFETLCLIDKEEYEDGSKLTKYDAGCNGSYALYSANDVTMFLSAMFPYIDTLLSQPAQSVCFRWSGNIEIAQQRSIKLIPGCVGLRKNEVIRLTF